MDILFLFQGNSFSNKIASQIKARLPLDNSYVSSCIEFINLDKRNIKKLLEKQKKKETLPKFIYYSVDVRSIIDPIVKQYPSIDVYRYSDEWMLTYDWLKTDITTALGKKTYYGVPYKKPDWCGEINEVHIGPFSNVKYPYFVTKEEAKEFAYDKLLEKANSLIQETKRMEKLICANKAFIADALLKVQHHSL